MVQFISVYDINSENERLINLDHIRSVSEKDGFLRFRVAGQPIVKAEATLQDFVKALDTVRSTGCLVCEVKP